MPSWIGPWEIAIILVLLLLIFGPRKLPALGNSLGKSIRGFKKGLRDAEDEVKSTVAEVREATDLRETETVKTEAPAAVATAAAVTGEAPPASAVAPEAVPAAVEVAATAGALNPASAEAPTPAVAEASVPGEQAASGQTQKVG